jgi:CheY-like chemotaxis protein
MALIVLMEDDAATRTLVASVLKKDGHEVLAAENGRTGLLLVEDHRPDLVISDVQMPELNGFEMLARCGRTPILAATPVILLTSLQERAHMRIGMTTGADDYITKPFPSRRAARGGGRAVEQAPCRPTCRPGHRRPCNALEEQRHELAGCTSTRLAHELSERWPTGGADRRRALRAPPCCSSTSPATPAWPEAGSGRAHRAGEEVLRQRQRHRPPVRRAAHAVHRRGPAGRLLDDTNTRPSTTACARCARRSAWSSPAAASQQVPCRTYPDRQLPRFQANVALHTGPSP